MPRCERCALDVPPNLLLKHLGNVHKYDPNFKVNCDKCRASHKKWTSFKKHYWLKHGCRIDPNDNFGNLGDQENAADMDEDAGFNVDQDFAADNVDENVPVNRGAFEGDNEPQIQPAGDGLDEQNMTPQKKLSFHAAVFVGTLKERLLIPQSTVDEIIEGVSLLLEDYLETIKVSLLPPGQDVDTVPAQRIQEVIIECDPSDIFQLCNSTFQLNKFMSDNLHMVKPVKIYIGQREIWTKSGDLEHKNIYAYTIPFLKSLELCLNNDDIWKCFRNPLPHSNGVYRTVTDGEYYRGQPILKIDLRTLSIFVYYDDVEYTNPLGSKTHKLAMFYWLLGNIHPENRSSIRVHNLLAVTSSQNLKDFGAEPLMREFIEGMKKLGSQEGVTLKIKGADTVFHGCLNAVVGDTPASGFLGGFKEGVGGALRPCRRCLVRREDVKCNFDISSFELRDFDSHVEQLRRVCHQDLTPAAKAFWSKQYGIRSESCLIGINNVDITKCFPHDFMHIVLEGVLSKHCLYFIRRCIEDDVFSLDDLNNGLRNFDYDYFKKDKPSPILQAHLQNGLKQSAAQMLALGQTLPLIIGRWVDESDSEHLDLFILLMQIINIALAFELHEEDAALLTLMIRIHHSRFKFLYGDKGITPKWHYFLHLGEQLILFGPPRQHWCMRFESVHSYYKNIARRNKNFKNLAYTFATRRQQLQCLDLACIPGVKSARFLSEPDHVSSGDLVMLRNYANIGFVTDCWPDIPMTAAILVDPSVERKGMRFERNSIILLKIDGYPAFGRVRSIVVWRQQTLLIYHELKTVQYELTLDAYEVEDFQVVRTSAVNLNGLFFHVSLPKFTYGSKNLVKLIYHRHTEFMG